MKSKILIFSATYNESKNITLLLNYIEDLNLNLDILIVDDNSPDKTADVIKEYSKNKKNIHLIVRDKKSGLDTAHKLAFEYSKNNQYEYLITIDADLTHDPKKIPEFIDELKNTPFVLGSKNSINLFEGTLLKSIKNSPTLKLKSFHKNKNEIILNYKI